MITYSEFETKLQRLQRNREKTTPKQRETIYKTQFENYEKQLKEDAQDILLTRLARGMVFKDPEDSSEEKELFLKFCKKMERIVGAEKGEIKRIVGTLIRDLDGKKFFDAIYLELWPKVWFDAYPVYWLPHCHCRETPEAVTFYNDIIDKTWSDEKQVWISSDGLSWTAMLPPTQEEIEREKAEWP